VEDFPFTFLEVFLVYSTLSFFSHSWVTQFVQITLYIYIKLHFRAGQLNLLLAETCAMKNIFKPFPGKAEVEHWINFEKFMNCWCMEAFILEYKFI